jgi:hypothetical protein
MSDSLSLLVVDHEPLAIEVITKRHGSTHPQAFAFRGRDFIADALARDFALELGK